MDPRIENYMLAVIDKDLKDREYEASLCKSHYIFVGGPDNIMYNDFKLRTTFYIVDENSNFKRALIQKPTTERDMRSVCVVFPSSMTFLSIFNVFREAGLQVMSYQITEDPVGKQISAEVEFSTRISVAVAEALTYSSRNLLPACKVFAKLGVIYLDSYPVESSNRFENVNVDLALPFAFNRRICVEFLHIPMTEDWLEKIFKAYGAIEYIKITYGGPCESPYGLAIVQFESPESVGDVIRLNKKLVFTHKKIQVAMRIGACDGTSL